jgi:hypothetical protein
MPDYQAGKIYKIESFIGNVVYYGSTTNKYLSSRMAKHRTHMIKQYNNITSNQVLEYPDAKIYLVEIYPCNSKAELHSREGYYIKNNDCVNKIVSGRTRKEYRIDNKESIAQYKKEYYNNNKESISQKNKEYNNNNKESISQKKKEYNNNNKESISQKRKVYRENNKELISQRNKVYCENNKDKIKLRDTKPYTCDCGETIQHMSKSRHFKTQKHLKYINSII